jgi:hypothetical protein
LELQKINVPPSELCSPLVFIIQLQIGCVSINGGVACSQRQPKLFSPFCENADKPEKFSFPGGRSKNFGEDFFPEVRSGLGRKRVEIIMESHLR